MPDTMIESRNSEPAIAVTLSGGGHRASLFGLGVLLYLVESKKNGSVSSIASVSGGSITNAYIGKECDYRNGASEDFQKVTRSLWNRLVFSGVLFAPQTTRIYLFFVIISALVSLFSGSGWLFWTFANDWFDIDSVSIVTKNSMLFVALGSLFLFILLCHWRGKICKSAFSKVLFDNKLLSAITRTNLNHVICATELDSGWQVYFSGDFIYSHSIGFRIPKNTLLADVVYASAAYAPLLPVIELFLSSNTSKGILLTDGGVYNNMGDQWIVDLKKRKEKIPVDVCNSIHEADEVIVVNSTARLKNSPLKWHHRFPVLREFTLFYRIICAMFDQTTTTRRKRLFSIFEDSLMKNEGMKGVMVMLEQTPYEVLYHFNKTTEQNFYCQRQRALNVLKTMPEKTCSEHWNRVREKSLKAPTTLRTIKEEFAQNLVYHSFVLAMINTHVILGYPLFERLLDYETFKTDICKKYLG